MIRELVRLAALDLTVSDRVTAAAGGALGGAIAVVALRLVDTHWPTLLDPIRPH